MAQQDFSLTVKDIPLDLFLQLAKPYCQHVPLAILGEPVNVPQGGTAKDFDGHFGRAG